MNSIRTLVCIGIMALLMSSTTITEASSDENPVVAIETSEGTIELELYQNDAPVTVENFLRYVEDGFYDGLIFHRVIEGFMIQGGGFYPGMEDKEPTYGTIENEAEVSGHRNERGTIAMARRGDPDSASSQFFINHEDNPDLDWDNARDGHGYCVFGQVISGMDVVDSIAQMETTTVEGHDDVPVEDVMIEEVTVTGSVPVNGENDVEDRDVEEESTPFYRNTIFILVILSLISAVGIIFLLSRFEEDEEDEA